MDLHGNGASVDSKTRIPLPSKFATSLANGYGNSCRMANAKNCAKCHMRMQDTWTEYCVGDRTEHRVSSLPGLWLCFRRLWLVEGSQGTGVGIVDC